MGSDNTPNDSAHNGADRTNHTHTRVVMVMVVNHRRRRGRNTRTLVYPMHGHRAARAWHRSRHRRTRCRRTMRNGSGFGSRRRTPTRCSTESGAKTKNRANHNDEFCLVHRFTSFSVSFASSSNTYIVSNIRFDVNRGVIGPFVYTSPNPIGLFTFVEARLDVGSEPLMSFWNDLQQEFVHQFGLVRHPLPYS